MTIFVCDCNWNQNQSLLCNQCDQIGRFIGLWQQLIWPSLPTFLYVSKSFIFLVKLFLGNFYRHLAIFLVALVITIRFALAWIS